MSRLAPDIESEAQAAAPNSAMAQAPRDVQPLRLLGQFLVAALVVLAMLLSALARLSPGRGSWSGGGDGDWGGSDSDSGGGDGGSGD